LVVVMSEPMDHALLERVVRVTTPSGQNETVRPAAIATLAARTYR